MASVAEIVTEKILAMLDKGTIPWRKPWSGGGCRMPCNLIAGKAYRGINMLLLSMLDKPSRHWLTFNQAKAKGGTVRKGEKGAMVVFFKMVEGNKADAAGNAKRFPMMRYYTVFNLSQCDGIEDPDAKAIEVRDFTPIEAARRIMEGMPTCPPIVHEEQKAVYRTLTDTINLPRPETFTKGEEYYCAAFHEQGHATGHKSRLDRNLLGDGEDYAREELIAEMTAAFLCGEAGIDAATIENSAAYIDTWRKRISADPKLVTAAAQAGQKAADYIMGKLAKVEAEASEESED